MGGEFGQWKEWDHDSCLDWELLNQETHSGLQKWVGDLNKMYRDFPSLHCRDLDENGFEWIDCGNAEESVVAFLRKGEQEMEPMLVVLNFTPTPRIDYQIGVPKSGQWKEVLNSDANDYGGSGIGNMGSVKTTPHPFHNNPFSLKLNLPPLSAIFLSRDQC